MCKIMGISNIEKIKSDELNNLTLILRNIVCEANRDGFGYAIAGGGELFAEKFLAPEDFEGYEAKAIHPKMKEKIFKGADNWQVGNRPKKPKAIIAHGRTSTNYKGMVEYSHPFCNDEFAFIHNGVVDVDFEKEYPLETDNDSEYLAHHFWTAGTKGLSEITGYFAFMNLNKDGKINIVRDDVAQLHSVYIESLDAYVFATTASMLSKFLTLTKFIGTKIYEVKENTGFMVDGDKISSVVKVKKMARHKKMTTKEKQAFKDYGSEFDDDDLGNVPMAFQKEDFWSYSNKGIK